MLTFALGFLRIANIEKVSMFGNVKIYEQISALKIECNIVVVIEVIIKFIIEVVIELILYGDTSEVPFPLLIVQHAAHKYYITT